MNNLFYKIKYYLTPSFIIIFDNNSYPNEYSFYFRLFGIVWFSFEINCRKENHITLIGFMFKTKWYSFITIDEFGFSIFNNFVFITKLLNKDIYDNYGGLKLKLKVLPFEDDYKDVEIKRLTKQNKILKDKIKQYKKINKEKNNEKNKLRRKIKHIIINR